MGNARSGRAVWLDWPERGAARFLHVGVASSGGPGSMFDGFAPFIQGRLSVLFVQAAPTRACCELRLKHGVESSGIICHDCRHVHRLFSHRSHRRGLRHQ